MRDHYRTGTRCRPCALAAIAAAVAAERAANCKAVCEGCASGWMLEDKDGDLLHILPESLRAPWEYGTGSRIGCDAAAHPGSRGGLRQVMGNLMTRRVIHAEGRMTPEDLKMRDLYHSVIVMSSTRQAMDALRAAIQAAVAEERAACECVAGTERDVRLENAAHTHDDSWALIERLRAATADNITAAIRARGGLT